MYSTSSRGEKRINHVTPKLELNIMVVLCKAEKLATARMVDKWYWSEIHQQCEQNKKSQNSVICDRNVKFCVFAKL